MAGKAKTTWYLKQWRKHRGLTQEQLAERAGLSAPYISQLESGRRQYTQELLELLATELRCELADLIMRDPTRPEPIWSVWDKVPEPQREQALAVLETFTKKAS